MKFLFLALLLFSGSAFALDAVTTTVLFESKTHYVVSLTNVSDGSGESAVIKVDKSAIGVATDGAEAGSLDIEKVEWNCDGMSVRILWDHTTDDLALPLSGFGELDFTKLSSSSIPPFQGMAGKKDPRSTGATGDILLTTVGHTSGDTYNVTLWLRKNPS